MTIETPLLDEHLDHKSRMILVDKAIDGMEDVRAIKFLLNSIQDHIHKRLSVRSERSVRQDGLIYMISDWENELKS